MGPVANFLLSLAIATTTLVGGSLAWPRFTTKPRPALLQAVVELARKTPMGLRAADVLGVTDEAHVTPINVGQMAASAAANMKQAVGQRIGAVVVGNAVNQLRGQFDRMSPEQKEQVREIFCTPEDVNTIRR